MKRILITSFIVIFALSTANAADNKESVPDSFISFMNKDIELASYVLFGILGNSNEENLEFVEKVKKENLHINCHSGELYKLIVDENYQFIKECRKASFYLKDSSNKPVKTGNGEYIHVNTKESRFDIFLKEELELKNEFYTIKDEIFNYSNSMNYWLGKMQKPYSLKNHPLYDQDFVDFNESKQNQKMIQNIMNKIVIKRPFSYHPMVRKMIHAFFKNTLIILNTN
jgi:hypothetical protein